MGSAPIRGMMTALVNSLSITPKMIPPAIVRSQLFGRAYPMSDHGVRDHHTQSNGTMSRRNGRKLAVTTSTIDKRPTGPKPRDWMARSGGALRVLAPFSMYCPSTKTNNRNWCVPIQLEMSQFLAHDPAQFTPGKVVVDKSQW